MTLLIDMQERLMPVIHEAEGLVRRAGRLLAGCAALGSPYCVTQQYTRGLGHTVSELRPHLERAHTTVEKSDFSAATPRVLATLEAAGTESVILVGVETHICVMQTALDLLAHGLQPVVCLDAVGSRRPVDRDAALRRMEAAGVLPATVESVLMEWCGTASHPRFRAIRDIIASRS